MSSSGWFDLAGPLHFLRKKWSVGRGPQACWVTFSSGAAGVTLQAHTKRGKWALHGTFLEAALWNDMDYRAKEDWVMGWIRDLRSGSNGGLPGRAAVDSEWLQSYPAIHDHLVERTRPDGQPRRTSTLTVFADGPGWKVFLNERDAGASLCATGGTIAAALSALEVLLEEEDTPWRFDSLEPGNLSKKKRQGH